MYFEKFYEGAAITGIQDPDNVGNDLEEIENAVEDSHDEEVDDALCGLPGEDCDPFEESAEILYEAEYNFNMICKSIGLSELNEAARGSLNENKFTDAMGKAKDVMGKAKDKVVEIAKAFVRWLISLKDKLVAFYNKAYANIINKNTKDLFAAGDAKSMYKKYKNEIDTYISNNTLKEKVKLLDFTQWNYAYNNIYSNTSDISSYEDFVKTITIETDKLDINTLRGMIDKDNIINSLQTIYKSVMKKLDEEIKKFKGYINKATEHDKDKLEDEIKSAKENEMLVIRKFNYLVSLVKVTEATYRKAMIAATKDKKDTKDSKKQTAKETPKTESVFDIKFM